jgi:exopolysaccharide biosynthesis polyprenyl glycosylphosphotransferase
MLAAGLLIFYVRIDGRGDAEVSYLVVTFLLPAFWILTVWLAGGYGLRLIGNGSDELRRILAAGMSLAGGAVLIARVTQVSVFSSYVLAVLASATALDLVVRRAQRERLHRGRALGLCMYTVVAVGYEAAVANLVNELRRNMHDGLAVVATCIAGTPSEVDKVAGVPVFGGATLDDILEAVLRSGADAVAVLSCPEIGAGMIRVLADELRKTGTDLRVVPSVLYMTESRTAVRPAAGLTLHVDGPQLSGPRLVLKDLFDRCMAAVALLLLAPVLIVVAVAIKVFDKGPALFAQTRVGKDGHTFTIYKFRTMVVDAEARLAELTAANDLDGVLFKLRRDPRITPIGAMLRKHSLDELPQLINVLKGEMSLIGPRPPLPPEAARYADHVRRRLIVKPGMTGMWQVNGRSDLSWEESVRMDLRYVEFWSFALDLQILWRTVPVVLYGSGAY